MLLSEKAKGKQRAHPDANDYDAQSTSSSSASGPSSSTTPAPQTRTLVVRFTDGIPDLTLSVSAQDHVRDVKRAIRTERPMLERRRLRLICLGRLLTDGVRLVEWLETLEDRQRRASSRLDEDRDQSGSGGGGVGGGGGGVGGGGGGGAKGGPEAAVPSWKDPSHRNDAEVKERGSGGDEIGITWLHCSVGQAMEPEEEGEEDGNAQAGQLQPARGFDRLAALGFSESDISNFRRQFHSHSSANYLDDAEFETEEEYSEHARALEELWIDSLDSPATAMAGGASAAAAAQSSIAQGILVGFFFPLLPFFFMRKERSPAEWENGMEMWEGFGSASPGAGSVVFS
ncbi:hypothetical protein HGRIS_006460 [Hohenbuehelia grisea]|uniref:Ubiquitin-like domain-containing protein n=1 Tax=Hohenbuehelia grisea TaxID=104357 RepID=A0ABR3K006_9AGAR